jgi:error-prone DNA polymerase
MEVAIVAAGFTPTEADQLRRSMASFKADGRVGMFEEKLVKGMTAKGYSEEYSRNIFKQLKGFSGYGFPESHSASFALLAYVSAWLKYHYPDVFAAGLLNSQPMGFYQPAQIISCAQKHGVRVRAIDINYSSWENTLEEKEGKTVVRFSQAGWRAVTDTFAGCTYDWALFMKSLKSYCETGTGTPS